MVKFDPSVKAKVMAMSDARKWLLIKSYIATGGTVTFDSGSEFFSSLSVGLFSAFFSDFFCSSSL